MTPWHLRQAVRCLYSDGVIAYPTEAVFGLGCDPLNPNAIMRLLDLKQRKVCKGLILIAAEQSQLEAYIETPSQEIQANLDATWPGPVTWLVKPRQDIPQWLTGSHDRLAVRVTSHPVASTLCRAFGGALVSTSANPSQCPPARNTLSVHRYFQHQVDYIVNGPLGTQLKPTEIRDACSGKILRPG